MPRLLGGFRVTVLAVVASVVVASVVVASVVVASRSSPFLSLSFA